MAAKSVPFSIEQDGFIRLSLEDGAKLRLRPVVVDVRVTEGQQDESGAPIYEVASFVHIVLEQPPKTTKS